MVIRPHKNNDRLQASLIQLRLIYPIHSKSKFKADSLLVEKSKNYGYLKHSLDILNQYLLKACSKILNILG